MKENLNFEKNSSLNNLNVQFINNENYNSLNKRFSESSNNKCSTIESSNSNSGGNIVFNNININVLTPGTFISNFQMTPGINKDEMNLVKLNSISYFDGEIKNNSNFNSNFNRNLMFNKINQFNLVNISQFQNNSGNNLSKATSSTNLNFNNHIPVNNLQHQIQNIQSTLKKQKPDYKQKGLQVTKNGEILAFTTEDISKLENSSNIQVNSLDYIKQKYPELLRLYNKENKMNPIEFDNLDKDKLKSEKSLFEKIKEETKPLFYVIKTFTEEDIHKSVKYGIWSSTNKGNNFLSEQFIKAKKDMSNIYLFFSMNNSGRFSGICKMKSENDKDKIFDLWASESVWKGEFSVEWLVLKDFPNKHIKQSGIINSKGQNVIYSRDCSELNYDNGMKFINEYESYIYMTSLLQHFEYFDEREQLYKDLIK